jgi:abequosyltransferase
MEYPLLTIAIPTYNREKYLKDNLLQLKKELDLVEKGLVELIISDNCSSDNTESVTRDFINEGMPIKYVKNQKNFGWGFNFIQCFNLAKGKYVLILGDDDLIYNGGLGTILNNAGNTDYGLICIRPYGFEEDFESEYPGLIGNIKSYDKSSKYLSEICPVMRSISACIINKKLISDIDFSKYPVGNFAHLNMVMHAILKAKKNLFINHYIIACKRNNSFGYDFSEVFVREYWELMDSYLEYGLDINTIKSLENQMLFTYYPFYILKERIQNISNIKESMTIFDNRFNYNIIYILWVKPIFIFPRYLAIAWGIFTTSVGRSLNGEALRGVSFLWKTKIKGSRQLKRL